MEKLIFMLWSPIWVNVEDLKGKLKYLVRKTFPGMCDRIGFKFYKKQTKFENHKICHDIICGDCDKKLRRFCKSFDVRCLWNEASPNKFHRQEKDSFGFWVKLMIELGFQFKNFCIGNRQDGLFHAKFWIFLESVR